MSFLDGITKSENDSRIRYIKENETLSTIDLETDINSLLDYLHNHILNPFSYMSNSSFLNSCDVVKTLLKLTNKKSIMTEKFYGLLDMYMITRFEVIYEELGQIDVEKEKRFYPIIMFYDCLCRDFEPFSIIMYPLFHGLGISMETENLPRIKQSLSKFDKIKQLSSIGYPISEIHLYTNYLLLRYVHDHSEKLYHIGNPRMKLSNQTVKILIADFREELNDETSDSFDNLKIMNVFQVALYITKSINDQSLLNMLIKAVIQGCKTVQSELYVKDNEFKVFLKLDRIIRRVQDFMAMLFQLDPEFDFEIYETIKVIFQSDHLYIINTICLLYKALFEKSVEQVDDCEKNLKIGMKLFQLWGQSRILTDAITKFMEELADSIGAVNEDKLKDMVKYFDSLTKILKRLVEIEGLNLDDNNDTLCNIFMKLRINKWNSRFKRDFIGHYAYYLDYKLKNIPKSKDRTRLENSIQDLIESFKIVYSNLNVNQKIRFKKRYLTLLVQRLLNTLFDNNEALGINICDCEEDFGAQFDQLNQTYFNNEFEHDVSKTIKDLVYSYTKFQEYNKLRHEDEDENFQIIGLNNLYNLNQDVRNGHVPIMALSKHEIDVIKEYKKWIKKELINDKVVMNSSKIKLDLDYALSKYEIQFDISSNEDDDEGEVVTLVVNMYQGMILQLFNKYSELNADKISELLHLDVVLVNKHLGVLGNKKNQLLIRNDDNKWTVNDGFKVSDKVRSSGGVVVIK